MGLLQRIFSRKEPEYLTGYEYLEEIKREPTERERRKAERERRRDERRRIRQDKAADRKIERISKAADRKYEKLNKKVDRAVARRENPKNGLQRLANKVEKALLEIREIENPFKSPISAYCYGQGQEAFTLDGKRTDPAKKKASIKFRSEASAETLGNSVFILGVKEVDRRKKNAKKMFSILMKDSKIADQLMNLDGDKLTLTFNDGTKKSELTEDNTILLDPKLSPRQMAAEFAKQFSVVQQREGAAKQADDHEPLKAHSNKDKILAFKNKYLDEAKNLYATYGANPGGMIEKPVEKTEKAEPKKKDAVTAAIAAQKRGNGR